MSKAIKPEYKFTQEEIRFFQKMNPASAQTNHSILDWMNHAHKKQGYAEKNRIVNISLFVCFASILIVIYGVI